MSRFLLEIEQVGDDGTARVWDTKTWEPVTILVQPQHGESASWTVADQRVRYASDNAWRWLRA